MFRFFLENSWRSQGESNPCFGLERHLFDRLRTSANACEALKSFDFSDITFFSIADVLE